MALRLFDTHVHLDDERFSADLPEVLSRASEAGVERLLQASYDLASSRASCALARSLADPPALLTVPAMWCAVGIHPHDASSEGQDTRDALCALLEDRAANRIVAVGEIGLDYHYDLSPRDVQRRAFTAQLELARAYGLPVIIHEREAHEDCLAVLREFGVAPGNPAGLGGDRGMPGVFHCFSGSVETAKTLISMGFYLGFDGPLTFRNARKSHEVVRAVPQDRLLIETDCPYLTPEPFRGRRNEPAYVRNVAQKLGDLLECTLEAAAELTWNNACRLFDIDP
jgi:TatD DNase family protein